MLIKLSIQQTELIVAIFHFLSIYPKVLHLGSLSQVANQQQQKKAPKVYLKMFCRHFFSIFSQPTWTIRQLTLDVCFSTIMDIFSGGTAKLCVNRRKNRPTPPQLVLILATCKTENWAGFSIVVPPEKEVCF